MIDSRKAAKRAVTEAEKRVEGELEVSEVNAAEQYVNEALNVLRTQSGGYDPQSLATDLARSAVVEYAKAHLLGQNAQNSSAYRQAAHQWSRQAAAEHHKQRHDVH